MGDLIERLRLQAEIGLFDAANTPGHKIVSYDESAAEIERLTAELASARALLAQYEQAPVVGWMSVYEMARLADKRQHGKDYTALINNWSWGNAIALIARPEANA